MCVHLSRLWKVFWNVLNNFIHLPFIFQLIKWWTRKLVWNAIYLNRSCGTWNCQQLSCFAIPLTSALSLVVPGIKSTTHELIRYSSLNLPSSTRITLITSLVYLSELLQHSFTCQTVLWLLIFSLHKNLFNSCCC